MPMRRRFVLGTTLGLLIALASGQASAEGPCRLSRYLTAKVGNTMEGNTVRASLDPNGIPSDPYHLGTQRARMAAYIVPNDEMPLACDTVTDQGSVTTSPSTTTTTTPTNPTPGPLTSDVFCQQATFPQACGTSSSGSCFNTSTGGTGGSCTVSTADCQTVAPSSCSTQAQSACTAAAGNDCTSTSFCTSRTFYPGCVGTASQGACQGTYVGGGATCEPYTSVNDNCHTYSNSICVGISAAMGDDCSKSYSTGPCQATYSMDCLATRADGCTKTTGGSCASTYATNCVTSVSAGLCKPHPPTQSSEQGGSVTMLSLFAVMACLGLIARNDLAA